MFIDKYSNKYEVNVISQTEITQNSNNNISDISIFDNTNPTEELNSTNDFYNELFQNRELTSLNAKIELKSTNQNGKEYEVTTSNGISIRISNPEDVEILEDANTGELIIIGAKNAVIKSKNKDSKISIYDSDVQEIKTKKGNDEINLYNTNVQDLKSGLGIDEINAKNSNIENINTSYGNDYINIKDSKVNNLNTSSNIFYGVFDNGNDTVIVDRSNIINIETGWGADNILSDSATINTLNSGYGEDITSLNKTTTNEIEITKSDFIKEEENYLNLDKNKISEIGTNTMIQMEEGKTISLSEYSEYILSKDVGLKTEDEYKEYTINLLSNNLELMKSTLSSQNAEDGIVNDSYNFSKELLGLGITNKDIESLIQEQEEMVTELTKAYNGESDMSFEEAYEYYTGTEYSQEKIDKFIEVSKLYSIISAGTQVDKDYAEKFEAATGQKVEDICKEFALNKIETFGRSETLTDLTEKYSNDQNGFTDRLSSIVSGAGMACIVVGALLSCTGIGATVGVPLMSIGKTMTFSGMLLDNGLDLLDDLTDEKINSKEENNEKIIETGVELITFGIGRAIGAATNLLNGKVSNFALNKGASKITSYILGQAAETTTDTVLSLSADYTIAQGQSLLATGEFLDSDEYWSMDRFLGEGKNQLMGILIGVSNAKVNAYQQATIKTAQDLILKGNNDEAKIYLNKKGIKIDFENFQKQVYDAEEIKKSSQKVDIEIIGEDRDIIQPCLMTYLKHKSEIHKAKKELKSLKKGLKNTLSQDTEFNKKEINTFLHGIKSKADIQTAERILEFYKNNPDKNAELLFKESFFNIIKHTKPEYDINSTLELYDLLKQNEVLSKEEKNFLIKNSIHSPLSPSEYIDTYSYLRDLKFEEGSQYKGKNIFDINRANNTLLLSILTTPLDSVEASNMQMYLDLLQCGIIDTATMRSIPIEGTLNTTTAKDIELLYDAHTKYLEGRKTTNNQVGKEYNAKIIKDELIDSFIPTRELSNIQDIATGDVFQVQGEQHIRIKTENGESIPLHISKETYFKLFPPITRYSSIQSKIGNCWQITGINGLLADPKTRHYVLETLKEDGNDILVKLPNCDFSIRIKDGEIPTTEETQNFYSIGAQGVQILEYAHGIALYNDRLKEITNLYNEHIDNAKNPITRKLYEHRLSKFLKFETEHHFETEMEKLSYKKIHYSKYKGKFVNFPTELRNGGHANKVYSDFDLGNSTFRNLSMRNYDKIKQEITNPQFFEDKIVSIGTGSAGTNGREKVIDQRKGIVSTHVYRLEPKVINENGEISTFKMINPWGIEEVEVTLDELFLYDSCIYYADKTKKDNYE